MNEFMIEVIQSEAFNGYTQCTGAEPARRAISEKFGSAEHPINPDNVFLGFGCSGALYNAVAALCERGDRLLVPSPGFPLCQPICENMGIEYTFYKLLPQKGWEVDLEHLKS